MTEQPWDPYRDGAESWQDAHVRQAQQPGMRHPGWDSPDLHPTWAEVIDKLRGSA